MGLGAHEVQALFEVIEITPTLGPHVERGVHARQALIAFLRL